MPDSPSRQTRKTIRNSAAKYERQNTTVQVLSSVMKRAMVPPELHRMAEPATSRIPSLKLLPCDNVWTLAMVVGIPDLAVRHKSQSDGAYGTPLMALYCPRIARMMVTSCWLTLRHDQP